MRRFVDELRRNVAAEVERSAAVAGSSTAEIQTERSRVRIRPELPEVWSPPYTPRVTVTATSVGEPEQLEPQAAPALPGARRVRRLLPAAAAALSGVLLYASFPPRTLWWLALPAFAVFGWTLRNRSWKAGLGLGYLF